MPVVWRKAPVAKAWLVAAVSLGHRERDPDHRQRAPNVVRHPLGELIQLLGLVLGELPQCLDGARMRARDAQRQYRRTNRQQHSRSVEDHGPKNTLNAASLNPGGQLSGRGDVEVDVSGERQGSLLARAVQMSFPAFRRREVVALQC